MTLGLSIGSRWALQYTLATLLLLALLTATLYTRISNGILEDAMLELRRHTTSIAEMVARHPENLPVIAEFIEAEIASSATEVQLAIELYDDQGQVILRRDILAPFPADAPRNEGLDSGTTHFYREQREATYPFFVMLSRNKIGGSRVAIYGGPFLQEIKNLRQIFALVVFVGVALTALIGIWLTRQTLRPIVEITDTARRVSSATDSDLIPVRGNGDELDVLAGTLNEMLEKIRQSADRMRRFAAQAAHELRTPLSVARTRIEVTLTGPPDTAGYAEVLSNVLNDLTILQGSIDAILDIARSEAGLDHEQMEELELSDLLESVTEFFRPLAEERGLFLHSGNPKLAVVLGDRIWLYRLFSNLIDNAIKYSEPGGTVELSTEVDGGFARVKIQDRGIGISLAEEPRIFDRFYRGEDAQTTGHGLGLALSMEIARAHGGTLEYERPCDQGSIFHVSLPIAPTS